MKVLLKTACSCTKVIDHPGIEDLGDLYKYGILDVPYSHPSSFFPWADREPTPEVMKRRRFKFLGHYTNDENRMPILEEVE